MSTDRLHLPDLRNATTMKIRACGFKIYVIVGFDESTQDEVGNPIVRPMEVFVKLAKHGTEVAGLMNALTTIISIALQSGVPWSRLGEKLRHHRFGAEDPRYSSIIDAVAQAVDTIIEHRCGVVIDDSKQVTK